MTIEIIYTYAEVVAESDAEWGCWLGPMANQQWIGQDDILPDQLASRLALEEWLLSKNPYSILPIKASCCVLDHHEDVPAWFIECNGKVFFQEAMA